MSEPMSEEEFAEEWCGPYELTLDFKAMMARVKGDLQSRDQSRIDQEASIFYRNYAYLVLFQASHYRAEVERLKAENAQLRGQWREGTGVMTEPMSKERRTLLREHYQFGSQGYARDIIECLDEIERLRDEVERSKREGKASHWVRIRALEAECDRLQAWVHWMYLNRHFEAEHIIEDIIASGPSQSWKWAEQELKGTER